MFSGDSHLASDCQVSLSGSENLDMSQTKVLPIDREDAK